jgi:hypothetical protein
LCGYLDEKVIDWNIEKRLERGEDAQPGDNKKLRKLRD